MSYHRPQPKSQTHADKELPRAEKNGISVDIPWVNLRIPDVSTDGEPHHVYDMPDFLHQGWRIKNQLLSGTKTMDFGGLLISAAVLKEHQVALGLCDADLDPHNKQDFKGMLRVRD